jgi:hypothetical protein
VFLIPCRKRSRQHSQSVLRVPQSKPSSSTNCSPKGFAALHAVMPFALAASFVTAAPVSCIPLRSVVILYTSFCFIRYPSLMLVTFGFCASTPFNAHNHKLHSLPTPGSCHSIPFRSFLFHSASCSPPAAIVVLACACRSGCGLSCFLHQRFVGRHTSNSIQQPTTRKQKITPALVRAATARPIAHSVAFS